MQNLQEGPDFPMVLYILYYPGPGNSALSIGSLESILSLLFKWKLAIEMLEVRGLCSYSPGPL